MPDNAVNVAKPSVKKLTITAIVIAITAFVSALGVLLAKTEVVVKNFKILYNDIVPQSYPYDVAISYAPEVPSYLRFYFNHDDPNEPHNLHWFRAIMHNKIHEPLKLGVSFQVKPKECMIVHLDPKAEPDVTSVDPGQTEPHYITPPFEWTNTSFDEECTLTLKYSVKDSLQHDEYPVKEVEIKILPRHVVKWDLTNINGNHVQKDFLLASLTAWTLSKDEAVVKRAGDLRKSVLYGSPEKWAKASYESLFQGSSGLYVGPTVQTYPFEKKTRLRSPGETLMDTNPEPLEAAMLMAALIHAATREEVSYTLFILPQSNPKQPAVLLAWSDPPNSTTWKAIDLRLAGQSKFEDNLQQSSELLQKELSSSPSILDFSKNRGVLFGSSVSSPSVISFQQAKNDWNIQPLP